LTGVWEREKNKQFLSELFGWGGGMESPFVCPPVGGAAEAQ